MNDGRKTRRFGGLNDKAREKAKLNREWQQISQVSVLYDALYTRHSSVLMHTHNVLFQWCVCIKYFRSLTRERMRALASKPIL